MDISKNIYMSLEAKPRSVALFAAINRGDDIEARRLTSSTIDEHDFVKAINSMNHVLFSYNTLISNSIISFMDASCRAFIQLAFCEGWEAAGGSTTGKEYQEKIQEMSKLMAEADLLLDEIETIRQAAVSWCKDNDIPNNFFSGPLCIHPLLNDDAHTWAPTAEDQREKLNSMKKIFNAIRM